MDELSVIENIESSMSTEFLTVEAAAEALRLHPKTVLRFIREGRLRATRVGKQYRLLRSDLNAFAGAGRSSAARAARVTCVVDIEAVDLALVQRLTSLLMGASQAPADSPISLNVAHDPARGSAKVIVMASPADAAMLLRLVEAFLES